MARWPRAQDGVGEAAGRPGCGARPAVRGGRARPDRLGRPRCCSPATPASARPGCSPSCAGRARAAGATVLVGHCVDLGAVGLPYLPFAEALRELADLRRRRRRPAGRGAAGPAGARPADHPARPARPAAPAGDDDAGPAAALRRGRRRARRRRRDRRRRCCWSSRTCTGPTSPPATCSPSCWPGCGPSGWPSSPPTGPTTCTGATRCARCSASWLRLPTVERVELSPFTAGELRDYLRALSRRAGARAGWCGTCSPAPRATPTSPRSCSRPAWLRRRGQALPAALADVLLARLERLPRRGAAGRPGRLGRRPPGQPPAAAGGDRAVRRRAGGGAAGGGHPSRAGRRGRRPLRVPARAAAGGGLRRPAAGRAGPAARDLREAARRGRGGRRRRRAGLPLACRATTCPGRCPPRCGRRPRRPTLHAPVEALRNLEQALQLWDAVPDAERAGRLRPDLRRPARPRGRGQRRRAAPGGRAGRRRPRPGRPGGAGQPRRPPRPGTSWRCTCSAPTAPRRPTRRPARRWTLLPAEPPSSARVWAAATRARSAVNLDRDEEGRRWAEEALAGARAARTSPTPRPTRWPASPWWPRVEGDSAEGADPARRGARPGPRGRRPRGRAARHTTTWPRSHYYAGELSDRAGRCWTPGWTGPRPTGLTFSPYGLELRVLQVIARYVAGDWDGSLEAAELAGDRTRRTSCWPGWPRPRSTSRSVPRAARPRSSGSRQLRGAWSQDTSLALIAGGCEADLLRWRGDLDGAVRTPPTTRSSTSAGAGRSGISAASGWPRSGWPRWPTGPRPSGCAATTAAVEADRGAAAGS